MIVHRSHDRNAAAKPPLFATPGVGYAVEGGEVALRPIARNR